MTLEEIEVLAKTFADARAVLAERVTALQDELRDAKRRKVPGIKSAAAAAGAARYALAAAVGGNREQFDKPRTHIFHGIKVGLAKGKGKISWTNAKRVIELIRKQLPDLAEVLIKTKETPIKKAISNLDAAQLKSIGCTIGSTGDVVVVTPIDDEVEKLVDALLDGYEAEAEAQA